MLTRVFGVLGPVEALVEMAAFVAVLWADGWRPGGPLPDDGTLLAASGAAFAAVVIGQAANAFACRDTADGPARSAGRRIELLLVGVGVEILLLGLLLHPEPSRHSLVRRHHGARRASPCSPRPRSCWPTRRTSACWAFGSHHGSPSDAPDGETPPVLP